MKLKRILSLILAAIMVLSYLPETTTVARAADDYNLLTNGNFDQGETGWGKNAHFTAGSVTDGALVVSTTKTTTGDAIFYQGMNLAPGTYQLTFDGKGTANTYRPLLYIGINQWSKVYGEHFMKNFGFGDEWKSATVQFTIPASAANASTGLAPVFVSLWTSNKSYAPETEMRFDNFEVRKLLSVTTELNNASLSTAVNTVAQGHSYVNTVTADPGYGISKVTVTMGGVEVVDSYDAATGKITIATVTGDLTIQVEAVQVVKVTSELNNAALSTEITETALNQSYENTVTADAGYEVSKVTVTMDGVEVPNVYNATTGKLSIAAVTGDLTIRVETVAIDGTNLLVNGAFNRGETGWGKNTHFTAGSVRDGVLVIPATKTSSGDAIFYQGMNLAPGTYQLTFDGKGTANTYRPLLYIGINQWSKVYGEHFLKNFGFGGEWKTATVQFTIPASAANANTGLAPVFVSLWTSNASYAPESEMQLDNFAVRRLFSVTTELNNAALAAELHTVLQGRSYVNTITANAGYGISKVTVTMGGVEVADAYDAATGKITVAAVTGDLVIQAETVRLLGVTTELNHAALSAEITEVMPNQAYENTITADAGYEVSKVTVTMGGVEVPNVYNATTGKLSIAAVTGDLHIRVETVAVDGSNLLVNGSFNRGEIGWANNGIAPVATIANGILTLSTDKTASGDARTYNVMNLAPGTYQLTFDVKGTPAQYRPYVSVSKNYWSYDYGQYFLYNYGLSDSQWTTITEIFTVPASAADANTGLAPVYVTIWNCNNSYAPVTEMQLDNFAVRKLVNVTTELNDAALSTEMNTVLQGHSYVNTVIANAGYEITKVTVTMGGVELANTYDDATGKLSIAAVTGDLHIRVETVALDTTNLLVNGAFNRGETGWTKNGNFTVGRVKDGVLVLPSTKTNGDAIFSQSMNLAPGTYQLTFDGKGTANTYRPLLYIGINQWSKVYGEHFLKNFGFGEEWKTATVQFTIPASAADANTGLAPVTVALWSSNASYCPETEMQLDNFAVRRLMNVTTELNHAALSTRISTVVPGQSYVNTVIADAGYEITKVTVTMGGTEVTNAYDAATGNITIAAVTGDVTIRVETVPLVKVTGELSHAALSTEITEIALNQTYENTVTADAGYEVSKVTVTMGGVEVSNAYNATTGKLSIAAVTGDLHIRVETVAIDGTNLLVNGAFNRGETGWGKNAYFTVGSVKDGVLVLPAAKTASGDAIFFQSMNLAPGTYQLTFDGKGTANTYRPILYIGVNQWSKLYGEHFLKDFGFGEEWKTATVQFTVPASAANSSTGLAPVAVALWSSNASYGPETEMQLDNFAVRRVFSVTTELSNAALSEEVKAVMQGQGYVNTVTANPGFKISKVTVTMGGTEVTDAYDEATGKLSIAAVTADLSIRVEAVPLDPDNMIINGDFELGDVYWTGNGVSPAATIADGVLTVSTDKTASGDARTYVAMQLEPGIYQLTFDAKGKPSQYRPYVSVSKNYWTNDYGQYFLYDYDLSDEQWTTVTEYFTVPGGTENAESNLLPVYVTLWTSNSGFAPKTTMQFDNFGVRKCFDVTVQNPDGKEATGLAEYTLPYAVSGAAFELILERETSDYTMTVSCTMGGVDVPVTVNKDGTVTVQIGAVSDDIVITVDSRKSAYDVTTGKGITNSNSATSVAHGEAYTAKIECADSRMKLYSLSYTMGRKTVEVPVVDNAAEISIDAVTGDITIIAVLVDKNMVAQWSFDESKAVTGIGGWGDADQTVAIAHNGYYDSKNDENGQSHGTANVAPDLLTITTNLPSGAVGWAEASTVIGFKLPADLEKGATYMLNVPIYAGNDHTSMVSSKNKSTRSGMELVFTTIKPENMWNAGDNTVKRIYAEGNGVLAASAPSLAKLSTDSSNVYRISFTVTDKIMEYAVSGNYLALIINHQHKDGSYMIGNPNLVKITNPAVVTCKIGSSVCDGPKVVQIGDSYTAQIVAKPGHTLLSASYTMGGERVKVKIVDGVATIQIDQVTGNIAINASTWDKSKKVVVKPAILGTRPNPSPYDDYPYICDEEDNLMPNFGFEEEKNYLENTYSKIVADENAWEGNYSLHYAPTITADKAANMLVNGDLADWDATAKTITGWEFNNAGKMDKLELVEKDGRHAVKLKECNGEQFNLEMTQRIYLEADFTYTFSFDFYGVAHWGPNLIIYDANRKHISSTNSKTTGTEDEWTTLSTTFRPNASGYYYFVVRIHNAAYPQKEQYISNCSVTLKSTRVEYELTKLKRDTNYWLTLFVKASEVESVENSFITFGLTDPETGNFIVMKDPSQEGARPYKANQQLVPMAYDGQWHIITVPFNTSEATQVNFTIDGLNCEAWFDNIYIFEEENAKPYVAPVTDKAEAFVTDSEPKLVGCEDDKNLFENHDLNDGDDFWGDDARAFGLFGNVLKVADSGSAAYGNALHYASGRPNNIYYIKWIDVEPNTEYTFSARYAISQPDDAFMGLINGYRVESEVTENRLFPTMIAQFSFGEENYLESRAWQTAAVSFNSGERNRIGFVICDAGGEVYIDELRLFKSSDGIAGEDIADTLPQSQNSEASGSNSAARAAGLPANHNAAGVAMWSVTGALVAAAMGILMVIQKKRKNTQ